MVAIGNLSTAQVHASSRAAPKFPAFEPRRTFYEAGRFQQAAEEFGEAYKLSGRPQLLYDLYVAHRDAGNTQAAVDALGGYLDKVPDAPDRINLRASDLT